jgi:hypothetical protein
LQLFLIDFCYFVNFLCFAHLFVLPRSSALFTMAFACANGPVAFAIIAWRNSLVFHELEKVTSVFIHFLPALLMFSQRWLYPGALAGKPHLLPPYLVCPESVTGRLETVSRDQAAGTFSSVDYGSGAASAGAFDTARCTLGVTGECVPGGVIEDAASGEGLVCGGLEASAAGQHYLCNRTFWSMMALPLIFYVVWQVFYFVKTEVLDKKKLDADPALATSLRWLARSGKGFLHDLAHSAVVALGLLKPDEKFDPDSYVTKFTFIGAQFLYTVIALLPTKLMYDYYYVHAAFLGFFFVAATWNGSAFYIEVFSVRYQRKIEQAIARTAEMQAASLTKAVEAAIVQQQQQQQQTQQAALAGGVVAGAGALPSFKPISVPMAVPQFAPLARESSASSLASMASTGSGSEAEAAPGVDAPAAAAAAAASAASQVSRSAGAEAPAAVPAAAGEPPLPHMRQQSLLQKLASSIMDAPTAGPGISYGFDFGALADGVALPSPSAVAAARAHEARLAGRGISGISGNGDDGNDQVANAGNAAAASAGSLQATGGATPLGDGPIAAAASDSPLAGRRTATRRRSSLAPVESTGGR